MSAPAHFLLRHFDRLAEAPGGIAKLRALVLQLAVNGKLGTHNLKDEPIENTGRYFKKTTEKESVPVDEQFLETTPENWRWIRFEWLGEISGGHTPSMNRGDFWGGNIPWVSPKDMHVDQIDGTEMHVTEKAVAETRLRIVRPGSLFFVTRSGILKRKLPVVVNAVPCTVNQDLKVLTPHNAELTQFIRLLLRGHEPMILRELVKTGTTVQSLKFDEFRIKAFPLPPLAEQRRIVAKVEELMGLCDALEAAQQEREAVRTRLRTSALHQLASPDSDSKSAAFVLKNLLQFTSTPEDLAPLRTSIRQLAVEGFLLEEENGPKSAAMRKLLIADLELKSLGSGKRTEAVAEPVDEPPFLCRASWEWARLGLTRHPKFPISYGVLVPGPEVKTGIPFVRLQDLDLANPSAQPNKRISHEIESAYSRTRLLGGEILIGVVGSIGKIGVAPESWRGANIARAICRLKVSDRLDRDFILLVLQSSYFQQWLKDSTRTLAQPTLNVSLLEVIPIPLPPLAEQRRIVAKVDELMAVLDALEATLTTARTTAEQLLAATIAKLRAA